MIGAIEETLHKYIYTVDKIKGAKNCSRQNMSVLQFIYEQHQIAAQNIHVIKNKEELENVKRNKTPAFFVSATGEADKPFQPEIIPRTKSNTLGLLRDYIAIDYDLEKEEEAIQLEQAVQERLVCKYAFYPSLRFPNPKRYRLVVEVNKWLDAEHYKIAAQELIDLIGVPTYEDNNLNISHLFNAPSYSDTSAPQSAIFQLGEQFDYYDVSKIVAKKIKPKETIDYLRNIDEIEPTEFAYKESVFDDAVNEFLEDSNNQEKLKNYNYFWRLAESTAYTIISGMITQRRGEQFMEEVSFGNPEWRTKNLIILEEQQRKLINSPKKRNYVQPLSSYLPITSKVIHNNKPKRIGQLFIELLPDDFEAKSATNKPDLQEIGDIVMQYFEFRLLDEQDNDLEALVIFNPLKGLWSSDLNDMVALISIICPALTMSQMNTIRLYWAAQANLYDERIRPYNKSRYLLFQNCCLDVKTLEMLELDNTVVKLAHFTSKHAININYDPHIKLKTFKEDTITGEDWSIEEFISVYAHDDKFLRIYFLFGLALGMFPGHNFGVHFNIQGESGSGKSTLSLIYKALFGENRIVEVNFSNLNNDFPMTDFNNNTAVVWFKECNVGISALNEDRGTPLYDSLADGSSRVPMKHGSDVVVKDPPQIYVDGTQLVQSHDISTGPARRTLAYKLPTPISDYRGRYYSNKIYDRLNDIEVLQYLVKEMILAYKEFVPEERQEDLKLNLGIKNDTELLPAQAQQWRQEFVSADANIRGWYETMIKENLILNNPDYLLKDEVFYNFYLKWYEEKTPNDKFKKFAKRLTNFTSILYKIFEEDKLFIVEYRDTQMRNRKKVKGPTEWAINWGNYDELFIRPDVFNAEHYKGYWKEVYEKKTSGLYYLTNKEPDDTIFTKKGQVYTPKFPTKELKDVTYSN